MFTVKIAVATNDQVRVTGHTGKCRAFVVYDINEGKTVSNELRENLFTNQMNHDQRQGEGGGHSHAHLIEGLRDCKYLISRGGGRRVVEDLRMHNINTIFADIELMGQAVDKFVKGELKNENGLICNHNSH